MHPTHTQITSQLGLALDWIEARRTVAYVTSHKDNIGNAGRIKRAGIAETVIIKLDRQWGFSGIFRWAGKGEYFSFKTGIPGGPNANFRQETYHEKRIPERDVTYIVLSVYLFTLIRRYPLNRK